MHATVIQREGSSPGPLRLFLCQQPAGVPHRGRVRGRRPAVRLPVVSVHGRRHVAGGRRTAGHPLLPHPDRGGAPWRPQRRGGQRPATPRRSPRPLGGGPARRGRRRTRSAGAPQPPPVGAASALPTRRSAGLTAPVGAASGLPTGRTASLTPPVGRRRGARRGEAGRSRSINDRGYAASHSSISISSSIRVSSPNTLPSCMLTVSMN